jgi:hypothetical protein
MKKIVLALVLILLVMTGRTQSFEGIMRWSMKMDITDPKAKAQMEEDKKKAADPANQAKMKELQAKMNDPQFKAMMDANPQMKAQIESSLKMMAGGDMMSSMMPTGVLIKLKGSNFISSVQGGIMDKNDVLHIADKDQTYTINHSAKTYMVMTKPPTKHEETKPKITKTSETATILGHLCTKYIIENTEPSGQKSTVNYWATTEIQGIDLKALAKQQMNKGQSLVYAEIDGVPLKIEMTMPQGTMTMEVQEIKKESLPASAFTLPAGYTETKI